MTDSASGNNELHMDFEALGLFPGATMRIQAVNDDLQSHHWVKFIGFIKNSSILATLPIEGGKGMWIQKGQTFILRGFNGRYAYAFTSQTLRARANPFAYIHLSWPHDIEVQVVRKSLRVDVALPVNVSRSDNTSVATTLLDVSIAGAMLDSVIELGALGDQIRVELLVNLVGNSAKINVAAIIRNIHPKENGGGFKTGIEFKDISQNDHLILNYYIDSVTQN